MGFPAIDYWTPSQDCGSDNHCISNQYNDYYPAFLTSLRGEAVKTPALTRLTIVNVNEAPAVVLVQYVEKADRA